MIFHLGYLDPGSGSILFQVVIGGVLGGGFALRQWASRLKGKVSGSKRTETSDQSDE